MSQAIVTFRWVAGMATGRMHLEPSKGSGFTACGVAAAAFSPPAMTKIPRCSRCVERERRAMAAIERIVRRAITPHISKVDARRAQRHEPFALTGASSQV